MPIYQTKRQKRCLEAWDVNNVHAPLNRNDSGLLPEAGWCAQRPQIMLVILIFSWLHLHKISFHKHFKFNLFDVVSWCYLGYTSTEWRIASNTIPLSPKQSQEHWYFYLITSKFCKGNAVLFNICHLIIIVPFADNLWFIVRFGCIR